MGMSSTILYEPLIFLINFQCRISLTRVYQIGRGTKGKTPASTKQILIKYK